MALSIGRASAAGLLTDISCAPLLKGGLKMKLAKNAGRSTITAFTRAILVRKVNWTDESAWNAVACSRSGRPGGLLDLPASTTFVLLKVVRRGRDA